MKSIRRNRSSVFLCWNARQSLLPLLAMLVVGGCNRIDTQSTVTQVADESNAEVPRVGQSSDPSVPGRFRRVARAPTIPQDQVDALMAIGYASGTRPAGAPTGVTVHRAGAYAGVNLQTDGHRPEATLMDMNGRELHRWHMSYDDAFPGREPPDRTMVDFWRRVYAYPNGDLLAIFEGQGLIKIDRLSKLIWAWPGAAHHDLQVLDDGRIYVLAREVNMVPELDASEAILEDFVVILDHAGREEARVSILRALLDSQFASLLEGHPTTGDVLHTNTLEVLVANPTGAGSPLRAGTILLSMREIDTVAVLDPKARRITWARAGPWKRQHQPTLLENGRLLVFDNLGDSGHSQILEVTPATGEVHWAYKGSENGLLSQTCGSNQRLPNGNTLITESDPGRALEVTADREIVWEFTTPHRAGEQNELIATLFETIRLKPDFGEAWRSTN